MDAVGGKDELLGFHKLFPCFYIVYALSHAWQEHGWCGSKGKAYESPSAHARAPHSSPRQPHQEI